MDLRPLLSRGERQLSADEDEWRIAADTFGLSPYVCKASFFCGLMRELIATSALSLSDRRYLGAMFLALDATELLGRYVGGFSNGRNAGARLRCGVAHLNGLSGPRLPALKHSAGEYWDLRNFSGHGAASLEQGQSFDQGSTIALLDRLAFALNVMWEDPSLFDHFAKAEIHPLTTEVDGHRVPLFVADVQAHLQGGNRPGERIDHEYAWRGFWLSGESPAPTGRG